MSSNNVQKIVKQRSMEALDKLRTYTDSRYSYYLMISNWIFISVIRTMMKAKHRIIIYGLTHIMVVKYKWYDHI